MLKKASLVIFALGSNVAFSGAMGPVCTPSSVNVPCPTTAWDVGIQALYLESLYNNNTLSTVNIGSGSGVRIFGEIDNDFEWGFRLEGSYHFSTGNDLNLNWTYWRDDNKLRLGPNVGRLARQITATLTDRYYGSAGLDAVNLEFGQHVDFGEYKNIRFHAGVQYADLDNKRRQDSVIAGAVGDLAFLNGLTSVTSKYTFEGAGPRVGADMSYDIGRGFAIYGNGAAALLIGDSKYSNNAPFNDETRPVHSTYTTLVPELEAKLGGKYTYMTSKGSLTFDVGYMVVNYFDPLHRSDLDLLSVVEYRDNINFGLQGAYAGVKWVGNVYS
ncbi:Lpg1974 family pore-forming outer membrane protein [Legionella brunensis]|uniref:Outer membrane protein n=1 Tax=Legionella brunensis TaxID=29422 RepID=A0A0W0SNM5_9GAMM|nr:Lpg1974 family pore-forming outer membrane protein [Legionella brunensis]KTC84982.1 outer membrane protein [Legionella brunensis]